MTVSAFTTTDPAQLLLMLRHMGRTLDDIEKLRIQHQLRRLAFERDTGMPVGPLVETQERLAEIEHEATLALVRLWRQHPLAPWAKEIKGVGEKSIARLIAEIGDPADRPNVAKLWAYCGWDPNRQPRKGMTQEQAMACGNRRAKKQSWLIAESLLKAGVRKTPDGDRYAITPAGELYLARRAETLSRDWTDGHRHNDALRILAKRFLADLWEAARLGGPPNVR